MQLNFIRTSLRTSKTFIITVSKNSIWLSNAQSNREVMNGPKRRATEIATIDRDSLIVSKLSTYFHDIPMKLYFVEEEEKKYGSRGSS